MNIKTIASAIAISSAMLLSGSAYAQTVIGGATVTAEDLPKVQERCDQLALDASTASATETDADADAATDGAATAGEATTAATTDVNAPADATTAVDLEALTLEACTEAGLTKAM